MGLKKKLKYIAAGALCVFSMGGVAIGTVAWFQTSSTINYEYNIGGESVAAYFAYGNGSAERPFGIATYTHLRNLAWLQYSGAFKNNNNEQVQYYFELANDIDCSGKSLPPIGTEEYPFIGHFSGIKSTDQQQTVHKIKNLVVSNKTTFSDMPATIDDYSQPEIVGFFGVVGELAGKPESKANDYSTSINKLENFVLDTITVESKTNQTLIGLAAGYVNGDISGVSINGTATLDVNGQTSTAKSSITNNLSDHGLVGYTKKTGSIGSFSQDLSEYYANYDGTQEGQGSDFGDSIDMLSLYSRLNKVYNEDSYDNGSFTVEVSTYPDGSTKKVKHENYSTNKYAGYYGNDYSYTFNKQFEGSQDIYFLYGDYSPVSGTVTNQNYVFGNKTVSGNQFKIKQAGETTYYFVSGNYYLKVPVMTSTSVYTLTSSDKTTDQSQATMFYKTGNDSASMFYITETYGGTLYYRFVNGGTSGILKIASYLPSSSSYYNINANRWTKSGNNYSSNSKSGYYISFENNTFKTSKTATKATCGSVVSTDKYLTASHLTKTCSAVVDSSTAINWFSDNNKIFALINDEIYYLMATTSNLYIENKVTDANATSWTYSNNSIYCSISSTTYYVGINPAPSINTSKGSDITEISQGSATYNNQSYLSSTSTNSSSIPYDSFKNTYMPLSVNKTDIYSTIARNSGYIISGKTFENTTRPGYNSGDIRVAKYEMNNINVSMDQDSFDNSKMYVITATSNSDYALITDSYNKGGTEQASAVPSGLSGISGRKASSALNRYDEWEDTKNQSHSGARYSMGDVFAEDTQNIYGLHFMDASIDKNDYVIVPNARINGKTYSDGLKMPKDSIDFFVKENGYITLFAGTYFGVGNNDQNSCFFSLHKIARDNNNEITSITEIQTIYKDELNNYYYNPQSTTGLTKVFDTAVLTNPSTFINKAVYYFEIPVDAGEYALGSVSGKNGAYLMYLDISASGEEAIVDQISAYHIITTRSGNVYPSGVDFAPVSVSGNGGESIGVYIASGKRGTVAFVVNSTNSSITITDTPNSGNTPISAYSFQGSKYSSAASPPDGSFNVGGTDIGEYVSHAGESVKTLYIDLKTVGEDTYKIRITETQTENPVRTYEVDGGSGYQISSLAEVKALSTEINTDEKINKLWTLTKVVTLTRATGINEFSVEYDFENSYYDDKILDVDVTLNNTTITIGTITTGYTFKIAGQAKSSGSTYPAANP